MASEDNAAEHAGSSSMPPNQDGTPTETDLEVWDYFTKVKGGDNKNERAVCDYCGASFLWDSENHDTSNMMMHLSQCEKCPYPMVDKLTLTPEEDDSEDGSSESPISFDGSAAGSFNAKRSREVLTKMIIVDSLPFGFVEEHSFRAFSAALQPAFSLPTRDEVVKDCFQYSLMKGSN